MSEVTENEIKAMTKEQNYMCGYRNGKSDVVDKLKAEIENHCGLTKENHCKYCSRCFNLMGVREILEVIDKYIVESEG